MPARLVVLASGTGSTAQALIDAGRDPDFGATVVAVGADRTDAGALDRARHAGIDTFVVRLGDFPERTAWDRELTDQVGAHRPDLIVSAGFMKLVGKDFLARWGGRYINSHPALLPSFPGMHGTRDALAYGVKITGCSLFVVDEGVDAGPLIAQRAVAVDDDDDEDALHEKIKVAEREMLVDAVGRMAREGWTVTGRKVSIP